MVMRKLGRDESGATVVIIALMIVALFGAAALAIDVARMYGERRELQRTADLSAISGAMQLPIGVGTAQAIGEYYVGENPTMYHPGAYNPADGDVVAASSACTISGITGTVPCVRSKVVAPQFPFLLAPVLGWDERSISAKATAVMGAGAPGGTVLIPWVLMDCARAKYGENKLWDDWNPSCDKETDGGYKFSANWDIGPFIKLYNTPGGPKDVTSTSNFQAIAFDPEPDCAATYDGLFGKSGGADYRDFLSGALAACTVDKGARTYTKTGMMTGPTEMGLRDRGVGDCLGRRDKFGDVITVIDEAAGLVDITGTNPCLVALTLVVHGNEAHPYFNVDAPGGCCISAEDDPLGIGLQEPIADPFDPLAAFTKHGTRLSNFRSGSHPYVVRRFAWFYITAKGGAADDWKYQGLFMKSIDGQFAELSNTPCDPTDGICVVKPVYEP